MSVAVVAAVLLGQKRFAGGIGASMGVVSILVALVLVFGLGAAGFTLISNTNLDRVNRVRASLASANSGYLADADISTGSNAVSYLPVAITAFLLGPPPWGITGFRQFVALPDLLAWWLLLPSLWTGIRSGVRRIGRQMLVFLLPALAVSAGLSLIIANFGTTVRERMQVVVLLLPVIAFGIAQRRGRSWFSRLVWQQAGEGDTRPGELSPSPGGPPPVTATSS
jgi:hypothetical protein